MNNIYMLILGMTVVTYLPRLIPFIIMSDKKLPSRLQEFLGYIPYAALGALIIPGFINAIPEHEIASMVGIVTALVLGYLKSGVVIPVLGSIFICMLLVNFGF
jgi:branched-subunit amino acid transport protein